jgi:hypothetical protein
MFKSDEVRCIWNVPFSKTCKGLEEEPAVGGGLRRMMVRMCSRAVIVIILSGRNHVKQRRKIEGLSDRKNKNKYKEDYPRKEAEGPQMNRQK